jgi:hypothetical protein
MRGRHRIRKDVAWGDCYLPSCKFGTYHRCTYCRKRFCGYTPSPFAAPVDKRAHQNARCPR